MGPNSHRQFSLQENGIRHLRSAHITQQPMGRREGSPDLQELFESWEGRLRFPQPETGPVPPGKSHNTTIHHRSFTSRSVSEVVSADWSGLSVDDKVVVQQEKQLRSTMISVLKTAR